MLATLNIIFYAKIFIIIKTRFSIYKNGSQKAKSEIIKYCRTLCNALPFCLINENGEIHVL